MTLTELQAAHARAKPNSRRRHELEIRLRNAKTEELRKEIRRKPTLREKALVLGTVAALLPEEWFR